MIHAARDWIAASKGWLTDCNNLQRIMVGALGGADLFRESALPIPWELWDRLVAILREYPDRFDKVIYVAGSGATVTAGDTAFRLLSLTFDWETGAPDEQRVTAALDQLAEYVQSDSVPVRAKADLYGFESTERTVELSSRTYVTANTASDLTPYVLGLITTHSVPQARFRLESRATVPIGFGDQAASVQDDMVVVQSLRREVELAAQVLVVFQDGDFTLGPTDIAYDNWVPMPGGQLRPLRPVIPTGFEHFSLDLSRLSELRALTDASLVMDAGGPHYVRTALRRFADAHLRSGVDDRLIDLMIAAEAIFLHDVRDELSYRLATRAALFLRSNRAERVQVFNAMKEAYDLRSTLVHGQSADRHKIRTIADSTEAYMREALRKALTLVGSGQSDALQWDRFGFLDL